MHYKPTKLLAWEVTLAPRALLRRPSMWDALVLLVGKHKRDALPAAHAAAASALQAAGAWREAERHHVDAGDWQSALDMYRCGWVAAMLRSAAPSVRVNAASQRRGLQPNPPQAARAPTAPSGATHPQVPGRVGGRAARRQAARRRRRCQAGAAQTGSDTRG